MRSLLLRAAAPLLALALAGCQTTGGETTSGRTSGLPTVAGGNIVSMPGFRHVSIDSLGETLVRDTVTRILLAPGSVSFDTPLVGVEVIDLVVVCGTISTNDASGRRQTRVPYMAILNYEAIRTGRMGNAVSDALIGPGVARPGNSIYPENVLRGFCAEEIGILLPGYDGTPLSRSNSPPPLERLLNPR